jgi:acetyl-CoA C-acetyltransferase
MTTDVDGRHPVLVGVGFASQDIDDPAKGVEVIDLMAQAATAAGADAGAPKVLSAVGRILVPRGTWTYPAPGRHVAQRIGADRARTARVSLGIPQQSLINEALGAIAAGDLDVAMVVGGEARRREVMARRTGVDLPESAQSDLEPDEDRPLNVADELMAMSERDARVVLPIQQYALIENVLGHAEGRTLAENQHDIATLYEGFDAVAAKNPRAAFAGERTAEFLRTPSERNRPIAFPYNKWHVTQMNVDQSVALLFCSADAAREHGIAEDRWVFPHVALESTLAVSLSCRRDMHRWEAMKVLGDAAVQHLDRPLASMDLAELYSCFPVAVRIQQRELGFPLDSVPTITGGMAFAGGPLNSFVLHETGEMAARLREQRGATGVVGAVSGLLTKPGLSVWSTTQFADGPLIADLKEEARAATPVVESVAGYEGPATIATYTVQYEGQDPTTVSVIGDTPDGTRCVAVAADADLAARGVKEDLIGQSIRVTGTTFEI